MGGFPPGQMHSALLLRLINSSSSSEDREVQGGDKHPESQTSILISVLKLLSHVTLENYLTLLTINFLIYFTDNSYFKKLCGLRYTCEVLDCLYFFKQ